MAGSVLRAWALATCTAALGACNAAHAQGPDAPVPTLEFQDLAVPGAPVPTIPFALQPHVNLDAVWWVAPRNESLKRLADRWGAEDDALNSLNPGLADEGVKQNQRILLYRFTPGTVSRSVGAPNRGRIENAAPFVSGDGWVMRDYRPRSYATRQTVKALATSLAQWRERYPEATPVKLGEFSRRGGGRVRPHKSHRTGRDVDIGYVMLEPDNGHRFVKVTDSNLNAEATWGLVRRLLASGGVESIFMAESVQEQLLPFAALSMSEAELRATFSALESDARARKKTAIKAWRGHDDHMHVRFGCTDADLGCRDAVPRKKKRRRKRRRKKTRHRRKKA